MPYTVVNDGKAYLLNQMTARSVPDNWRIGLYQNTPTIGDGTVLANVTASSFPGYADLALGTFAAAAIDGSNRAFASPVSNSFVFTRSTTGTAQVANGYYVYEGTTLICLEAFSAAFSFQNSGDALTLTFVIRDRTDTVP